MLYVTAPGMQQVLQLTPPPGGPLTRPWAGTVIYNVRLGGPTALTVAPDGVLYGTAYGQTPGMPFGSGFSGAFQLTPPVTPGGAWTYLPLTPPFRKWHLDTNLVLVNGNLYGGLTNGASGSIF